MKTELELTAILKQAKETYNKIPNNKNFTKEELINATCVKTTILLLEYILEIPTTETKQP